MHNHRPNRHEYAMIPTGASKKYSSNMERGRSTRSNNPAATEFPLFECFDRNHATNSFAYLPDKVWIIRIPFPCFLCVVAILSGYLIYSALSHTETQLAETHFRAVAERVTRDADKALTRLGMSAVSLAAIYANQFPDADQWPNVWLNDAEDITSYILRTASGLDEVDSYSQLGFGPFVWPDELSEFEQFAYENIEADYPVGTGISSFGKGVYGFDPESNATDKCYHDITGETSYGSPHKVLLPVLQSNNEGRPSLMFNCHSEPTPGLALDAAMACAEARRESGDLTRDCSVFSDFLYSFVDKAEDVASTIFTPIYPRNNGTTLTGVALSWIRWTEVLQAMFGREDSGFVCVLSSSTSSHTYTINNGIVTYRGSGELHDLQYEKYRTSKIVSSRHASHVEYTLSIYPSAELFEDYSTSNPLLATLAVVFTFAVTSLLFVLYDVLVNRKFQENLDVLEAKRRFVRFISHEVRTPLNTVCMGLKLMMDELQTSAPGTGSTNDSTKTSTTSTSTTPLCESRQDSDATISAAAIATWTELIQDITLNAQNAVDVLNDVLNYDKIESGTLKLELTLVPIWELLERTAKEFKLHAANAMVELHLDMGQDTMNLPLKSSPSLDSSELAYTQSPLFDVESPAVQESMREVRIVGDSIRLTQVLRNLLSNAQKFTPEGGSICIGVEWMLSFGLVGQETAQVNNNNSFNKNDYIYSNDNDDQIQSLSNFAILTSSTVSSESVTLANGEEIQPTTIGTLKVQISDSGAGMTPEQVEELFREGVQFNVYLLQAGGGNGLGLYIAKGIVEQHGGSITVASEGLGKGTTFTLLLPLRILPSQSQQVQWQLQPEDGEQKGIVSTSMAAAPATVGDKGIVPAKEGIEKANDGQWDNIADARIGNESSFSFYSTSSTSFSDSLLSSSSPSSATVTAASTGSASKLAGVSPIGESDRMSGVDGSRNGDISISDGSGGGNNGSSSALRILVVDDATSNRKMLMRLLSKHNHVCTEAKDGQEAVDKYLAATAGVGYSLIAGLRGGGGEGGGETCIDIHNSSSSSNISNGDHHAKYEANIESSSSSQPPFDVIVMDYEMPVMNGPTATKRLRELGCQCMIVGITGNVLPEDIAYFKSCGAQDVLPKPLRMSDLEGVLIIK